MSQVTPDQAIVIFNTVGLRALTSEHPLTTAVIKAIPADKMYFRPDSVSRSAIDLAWHIVGAEHRFMEAVANGVFDFTNSGRPPELQTSADVARWYADTFPRDAERIAALPVDALMKVVDFRGIFQLPAVAYLQTAQIHSIHHRGQLSMYLRPMGAKVPAIYGESYDSAQAKAAR